MFRSAIIIFLLGSIPCANAPNVTFLVVARFFEGMGGALMMPVGRLVLMRNVEKRDLIQATSWVLIPAVVGPDPGAAGGRLHRHLSAFLALDLLLNVPIGLLGIVLVSLFIANTSGEVPEKTDYKGIFLSSLSLGLFLFGFELISHEGLLLLALSFLTRGRAAGRALCPPCPHAPRIPSWIFR